MACGPFSTSTRSTANTLRIVALLSVMPFESELALKPRTPNVVLFCGDLAKLMPLTLRRASVRSVACCVSSTLPVMSVTEPGTRCRLVPLRVAVSERSALNSVSAWSRRATTSTVAPGVTTRVPALSSFRM